MDFQNQSKILGNKIDEIASAFSSQVSENEKISTVTTPQGSET